MATQTIGPLVVIVGQTASGKSSLAMALASSFNGEVIAADSRTVYSGMDIGTAKPTIADRLQIPHHLIDIVALGDRFTVADFKHHAEHAINEIAARQKLPMLVGGTGLYVDAVLFDYKFSGVADTAMRNQLQQLSIAELQHILNARHIPLPRNEQNKRHLMRQIETGGVNADRGTMRANTLVIGVDIDKDSLRRNVETRIAQMFSDGLEREVAGLVEAYGWGPQVLQTIGYQEFEPYFAGTITIEQVKQAILMNTLRYAKRQKTWFRRNKSIHWVKEQSEAVDLLTTFLSKS